MNSIHAITAENLLNALPVALQPDKTVSALAASAAEVLAGRPEEIDRLLIYPAIDRLDEELLDILAYDFKVDWWDAEYSLEEKRQTMKDSWAVHRMLGTKAAIETAIRAIYPLTEVEEWFTYGGEPYHFRLHINITGDSGNKTRQRRVLERLNYYKNLRSHNDGVYYFLRPEKAWALAGGWYAGSMEHDRTSVSVPPLLKPGGSGAAQAGGGVGIQKARAEAAVEIPPLRRPGGAGSAEASGAVVSYHQHIHTPVGAPRLTRPQGTATRLAAAGAYGSFARQSVSLNAGRARPPEGRVRPRAMAGAYHVYQRIEVYVNPP